MAVLVATGLAKTYGAAVAVHAFDAELRPGRIVGLVGNNGAGKTTVLKMLCGVLEPTGGHARVDGRSTTHAAARRGIGFLPEDSPLYEDQTPLAYLAFFGRLYGLPRGPSRQRAQELLRALRLDEEHWAKPIGNLSKGSARKVAIARALLHDPTVLLLDEPASGLELCDDIILLHAGRVVARGTLAQLRSQWGTHRYRLHATTAFRGSAAAGTLHVGLLVGLAAAEAAMGDVRAAGGDVLNLESVPPALDEILRRAAEA